MPPEPGVGHGEQTATAWAAPASGVEPTAHGEHHEFSDEQIALLSWWADSMAAGAVPPTAAPAVADPLPARTRPGVSRWAVIIVALLAVAALAAALVAAPKLLDRRSAAPAATAADVTLPSTVAGLVTITDAQVADGMRSLINYGLRPVGVIVTRAYGPAETGPLTVAAMATKMNAAADAAGQIDAWAQRTGSDVADPITGSGATADVVCAAATGTEAVPTGAFCVWTGDGLRGQTYVVDRSAKKALQLTAEVRAGTTS